MNFSTVLDNLIVSLKPSDPYKIILFGSYAKGNPNEDSDVDLLIILDNNHISKTYQERLDKKVYIRNLVLEINQKMSLDILVYSKGELNLIKNAETILLTRLKGQGKLFMNWNMQKK
jgi:predicted nucleotidyltransferase